MGISVEAKQLMPRSGGVAKRKPFLPKGRQVEDGALQAMEALFAGHSMERHRLIENLHLIQAASHPHKKDRIWLYNIKKYLYDDILIPPPTG